MEISNRIVQLLKQRISQTLDAAGHAELNAWADGHPAYRQLLDEVADETALKAALHDFHAVYGPDESASIRRMGQRIEAGIGSSRPADKTRMLRKWLPYVAATVAVLLAVGWLLLRDAGQQKLDNRLAAEEILPGGNRATLTLADGRVINLDEAQTGITVSDEDITYNDGSALGAATKPVPSEVSGSGAKGRRQISMLELTTPKGGMYAITLPDGSNVWLNAASTLRYPNRFADSERVVEIVGEGYLEIKKDTKRPFKVRSRGQEIEVLGTQFNITAYADEPEARTTLIAGKVRVDAHGASLQLVPGEQVILEGEGLTKHEVDVNQYISWKSGRFSFENKSFGQVFRELARWYDIDLRYEGPMPDIEFYGGAFRNKNLNVVLRLLESAKLAYRMEGRTLVINTEGEVAR